MHRTTRGRTKATRAASVPYTPRVPSGRTSARRARGERMEQRGESKEGKTASDTKRHIERIAAMQDYVLYRDLSWEGSFEEYLETVRKRPQVTRNAFQRVYDMIIGYGTEEYIDNKKKLVRYNFFKDELDGGKDAIFGLDIPLMRLVHVLRAASEGFGPEKRVILLQGPAGSPKPPIPRLRKKGLELYSPPDAARLNTSKGVGRKQTAAPGASGT